MQATNYQHLRRCVDKLRAEEPRLRSRDLADRLGVSEAEIVSLDVDGTRVVRLKGDFKQLLEWVKDMGYVMALTRNAHVVHERKGVYDNVTFYDGAHNMGVVVNPDIDLRLFMKEWVYALAVVMDRKGGDSLYGLQFYDAYGMAVHKIYTTPKSDLTGWRHIVDSFRAADQSPIEIDNPRRPAPAPIKPDSEVDVATFQRQWRDLQDTHHFFGLLRRHGLTRTQALRLAPEGMVSSVPATSVETMLERAAAQALPIMCFVHSPGCIQIHTGPVKHLKRMGKWFNVLDPKFNLHLDTEAIAASYVVRKPTADGIVTSLELYDVKGEMITYFFGARKPGKPQLEGWTELAESLADGSAVAAQA